MPSPRSTVTISKRFPVRAEVEDFPHVVLVSGNERMLEAVVDVLVADLVLASRLMDVRACSHATPLGCFGGAPAAIITAAPSRRWGGNGRFRSPPLSGGLG